MLKVAGGEAGQDEVDGRSLLDEIAREGARRMLVAALETELPPTWRRTTTNATTRAMPWSSATARAGGVRSRSGPGRFR
jgi:hypothetical protein